MKSYSLHATGRPIQRPRMKRNGGIVFAEKAGLRDYVWRLETVRGLALYALGRYRDAEAALRHAQAVIDEMAGTIVAQSARRSCSRPTSRRSPASSSPSIYARTTCRSRSRYLERGRARAFVSMMAGRAVEGGAYARLVGQIRTLDQSIIRARQAKYAIVGSTAAADPESALLAQRQSVVAQLRAASPALAEVFQVTVPSLSRF